jgi:hypothetical protein
LEFFKESVEAACERQRLYPQPLTSYYIVSLLADFTHLGNSSAAEALTSKSASQSAAWRHGRMSSATDAANVARVCAGLGGAVLPALGTKYAAWGYFKNLAALNIEHMEAELSGKKRIPQ